MSIETKIYDKLLNNLNKPKDKFYPSDLKKSSKAKYYFKDIKDNCYDIPHDKLDNRARAIYSSATMIYNLLGKSVTINNKSYEVIYEEELPAITPGGNKYQTHKAHLDATLRNNYEIIFVEAKMREWLGQPKTLKQAYLKENKYLDITEAKKLFIEFFKSIIKDNIKELEEYKSIYKKYDAIQMTIHILGIYNFVKLGNNNKIKSISLINCIWDYPGITQYEKEVEEATDFIKKANSYFKPIFKSLGIDFNIQHYSFHELKKLIDFSSDKERLEYLKRYDI